MSNIVLLTVDGVELPNPTKYDIDYKDLDSSNSYTSESGYLVRDMVRANHTTINVEWTMLKPAQTSLILQAVSGKPDFALRYLDKRTGAFIAANAVDTNGVRRRFYATDRKQGTIKAYTQSNGFDSLSFSIIEI